MDSATVLIVDDNLTNLGVLFEHLHSVGYTVLMDDNGESAIKHAQLALPDIILLDVLMPGQDGFETCYLLKQHELTRDIPVILMTALTDTEHKVKGLALGAVDYITKPTQYAEVIARISTHLKIRRLQKSLEARLAEREMLINELDAYAQTVAHDLKAPLALILGFAELLHEDYSMFSEEKSRQMLGTIVHNGRKMQAIIESLLLLARVRQAEVEVTIIDSEALCNEAMGRLSFLIEQTGARVRVQTPLPPIWGYWPWIEQVWVNLLSNAMKYGGEGPQITVSGQRQEDGTAYFAVRDNGWGLSPAQQERLFLPFVRLHREAKVEGHGLGLSIARRIVERFGGHMGVVSELGHGSTFFFVLPSASRPDNDSVV